MLPVLVLATVLGTTPQQPMVEADVIIKGATLYDGTGQPGVVGDLAIKGDRIDLGFDSDSEAERVGRVAPLCHEIQDVLGPHPGAREGPVQEEHGRLGRGRGRQRPQNF